MKGRRTLAGAALLIERQKSSGVSVVAFCKKEKINLATYYYWHQRLRKNPEVTNIIPVSFEKARIPEFPGNEVIELVYPNGVRLSIPFGCELSIIRQLVTIL